MSAFCDIWIGAASPVDIRKGNDKWKEYGDGVKYSISTSQNNSIPFISSTTADGYTLVVLGQFYEPVDQLTFIQKCIRYVEKKEVSFDDPAGHYILFLINNQLKEFHVFTNRFGTYHAYWLNDGVRNLVSTYFLGMARQSNERSLDWEGITGFFGTGFFPGSTTYLKSIQILGPASHYHFDASLNLVSSKRYWNWTISSQLSNEAEHFSALNETIGDCLSYAVKDRKVALPISGGLDSRMLAGIVTDKKLSYKSLWAYSYGYSKTSAENAIARKIANTRSIPFQSSIVSNYLFEQLPEISEAVELFQYVDGTRQACMREEIAANADVVIGGHWGDVWMDAMPIDGNSELFPAFEKKVLKRGRQWLLEIAQNFQRDSDSYLREYFASSVKQYDHLEDASLKFKAYKTDQWSFRWTLASIRMYQAAAFPVLPFYDKNIADLLLAVPGARLRGRRMQIDFIKEYQPDLAKITWQEYGRNLYSYQSFNNRNIAYRTAKKIQRIVRGERPITRNWELFYLNPEGRKHLEIHLLDNALLNEFIAKEKMQNLLDEFYRYPSADNGYSVSMLLTFGTALKKIFN